MPSIPTSRSGFKAAKSALLAALRSGNYQHEVRDDIDVKNLLSTGAMAPSALVAIINRATGLDHSTSPHHGDASITVHVLKTGGWYVKFYFLDPSTFFISVHQ